MSTMVSNGVRAGRGFRSRHRLAIACGLAALFLVRGARAAESVGPAQRLPVPEHVTENTRVEVKARMARHGETMSSLVRSVVLLDRPTIRILDHAGDRLSSHRQGQEKSQ